MKAIFTLVLTVAITATMFGQLVSKDATTSFDFASGSYRVGNHYAVVISDTITNTEADTIIFQGIEDMRKITFTVTGAELSGTIDYSVNLYASATGEAADIDYTGDGLYGELEYNSEGTRVVASIIPVLSGQPSFIGPMAFIVSGTGTQSSTYSIAYQEFKF